MDSELRTVYFLGAFAVAMFVMYIASFAILLKAIESTVRRAVAERPPELQSPPSPRTVEYVEEQTDSLPTLSRQ